MGSLLHRFARDRRGSAAVEMALVAPLLIVLLFGAFELGNYFLTEHKVVKAVRDGARYAARQAFDQYAGCAPSSVVVDSTRNVTRTGQVANGGTPRVLGWTNPATITVTSVCNRTGSFQNQGIYRNLTVGAPVVIVSATVQYTPLFAQIGLGRLTLNLRASSEAAVTGI